MTAFVDLYSELSTWVPKIDVFLSQKLVNRAWQDIQDSRLWSFNVRDGQIITPAEVTAGSASVVQGSATVTGDASATVAWNAVDPTDFITRQFRIGSGPVYNISSYDNAGHITLERAYGETTLSNNTYEIYKCYIDPPATDFVRWISFVDAVNGFPLDPNRNKAEIDRIDPKRGARGLSYKVASYRANPSDDNTKGASWNGLLKFELWPHPINQVSYPVLYERRGNFFTDPDYTVPTQITEEIILERAKYKAYEWAMANQGVHTDLKGTDWATLMNVAKKQYEEDLNQAIRLDEELFQQLDAGNYTYNQLRALNFSGSWAFNHAPYYGYRY